MFLALALIVSSHVRHMSLTITRENIPPTHYFYFEYYKTPSLGLLDIFPQNFISFLQFQFQSIINGFNIQLNQKSKSKQPKSPNLHLSRLTSLNPHAQLSNPTLPLISPKALTHNPIPDPPKLRRFTTLLSPSHAFLVLFPFTPLHWREACHVLPPKLLGKLTGDSRKLRAV